MQKQNKCKKSEQIISQPFHKVISESFKRYAKYIIQDRALPDIRDGLKPVQRRILYAMLELGLESHKSYKKSARTVGEVIGKYHPHGDSSIYEALVRMAQEWKNNLVLIDMQGNKGSIDGDPPAAMRYTEAKLAPFAEHLLIDIEKKIVHFVRNFDDSEIEPTVLPALLPNLLINGANGIASGYATNIPPHNPNEVIDAAIFRLENPNCTIAQLSHIIKGPDFPTGGIIQGIDGIKSIYNNGHGKINVISKINYNADENTLIIEDIPFETNKSTILKSIEEIVATKNFSGINRVIDSSDKNGVNIIIELDKSSSDSWETIKNYLLKNTPLQITYSANMTAIVNGKPIQFNLLQYFDAFLAHCLNIIVKTAEHDLKNAQKRLEIVSGLFAATKIVDQLIKIIRSSSNREIAKEKIKEQFHFSETQADAIIHLRLYNLTNTDTNKLAKEEEELKNLISEMKKILQNEMYRRSLLKKKMLLSRAKFAIKRKSKIEREITKLTVTQKNLIKKKQVYLAVSFDGYAKTTEANFKIDEEIYLKCGLKEKDRLIDFQPTTNTSSVVLITSNGNFLKIPVYKIHELKWKELGSHLNYLTPLSDNEKMVSFFITDHHTQNNSFVTLVTKRGLIKRVMFENLTNGKLIKTSTIMRFKKNDDQIISACCTNDENKLIYLFTGSGRALRYKVNTIPIFGTKSSGVKALNLTKNDYVAAGFIADEKGTDNHHICVISNSGAKRIMFDDILIGNKTITGKYLFNKSLTNKNAIITAGVVKKSSYINAIRENGENVLIPSSSIPISENASRLSYWKQKALSCGIIELEKC